MQQASGTIWIKQPKAVFGVGPQPREAVDGLILRDGKVAQILGRGESYHAPIDEVVDASDLIVLPGMICLLYTSPSPRDATLSRMPSSA